MRRFKSKIGYQPRVEDQETITGASETVPDDSYTIQELLDKHQAGLALNIKRLANFDDVDDDDFDSMDMEQFQKMEMTEQAEVAAEMGGRLRDADTHFKNEETKKIAAEKAAKKARIEAKKAQNGGNPALTKLEAN